MFSWDIEVMSGNGHPIFDVRTGNIINNPIDNSTSITIGDHVWCGGEYAIISNVVVGSGSIVGYKSTVKGTFPNNVVIVGIPAKVVRKDVAWVRTNGKDAEEFYINKLAKEYKKITEF